MCHCRLPLIVGIYTCGFSLPLVVSVLSSGASEVQQIHRLTIATSILPFTHSVCAFAVCFEVAVHPHSWDEAASFKVLLTSPPGLHRLCILLADLEWKETYVALSLHSLQLVSPKSRP